MACTSIDNLFKSDSSDDQYGFLILGNLASTQFSAAVFTHEAILSQNVDNAALYSL